MNIKIISAGAGSGKTHRLTTELVELLVSGGVRASGVIATTFTQKAAAELLERVRVALLEAGRSREADELNNALIGTVHSLGVRLLKRFAYEAGVSPEVSIIAEEDQQVLFNQSLATVLSEERVQHLEALSARLGLTMDPFQKTDWRRTLKEMTELIRSNGFEPATVERSKQLSIESLRAFLDPPRGEPSEWQKRLRELLDTTLQNLPAPDDDTKKTRQVIDELEKLRTELKNRGELFWPHWAKIAKLSPGTKSRTACQPLTEFARQVTAHPALHADLEAFTAALFDLAREALDEFERYKKEHGLIDYTDMEALVNRLLDQPPVREVLRAELDLLLVDEFQDTNPLQLALFLKLARIARQSIWVGDPKQSIYGFRGAEPALMQAIIEQAGGIRPGNIQRYSWRSRQDLVHAANALFCSAFSPLPAEQVALEPKRLPRDEPPEMEEALQRWHFEFRGPGRPPRRQEWFNKALANALHRRLEAGWVVWPKGEPAPRPARPGDVAILCRTNFACQQMAEALHHAGLEAAIARTGLLETAEARFLLAALKYILQQSDSLALAEFLLLGAGWSTSRIIEERLRYLERQPQPSSEGWQVDHPLIDTLNRLRERVAELSASEIVQQVLEALQVQRGVIPWGKAAQRLANLDALLKLAHDYEEACTRLHTAASLGGFLLYLDDLHSQDADQQGSSDSPEAVRVLTYHKSKGLEWPIVLCHGLEKNLRGDVWGLAIVRERKEVDLDDVLGHRWLRLWTNPFSNQLQKTTLHARITASAAFTEARQRERAEENRLLYVGFTRARDYLVLPTWHQPPTWLQRVYHQGAENPVLPDPGQPSPFRWQGREVPIAFRRFEFEAEIPEEKPVQRPLFHLPPPAGPAQHPPLLLAPEEFLGRVRARGDTRFTLQTDPPLFGGEPSPGLLHAWRSLLSAAATHLSTRHVLPSEKELFATAEGLLQRHLPDEEAHPQELCRLTRRFLEALQAEAPLARWLVAYPLQRWWEERLFQAQVDLLLLQEKSCLAVQHVTDGVDRLEEWAGWCWLCRQTLEVLWPGRTVRLALHFLHTGTLVEIHPEPVGAAG
ncbi:MAG: DNA helicase UvrD [Bacteroidetes bacterium]|nr:MAG: DNA helicase UvrD [Bacteroidota bacterium]